MSESQKFNNQRIIVTKVNIQVTAAAAAENEKKVDVWMSLCAPRQLLLLQDMTLHSTQAVELEIEWMQTSFVCPIVMSIWISFHLHRTRNKIH